MQKYESKLHKKIAKILPTMLDSLHAEKMVTHNRNLERVKELLQETSPSQRKRGEAIFMKVCTRTEWAPRMDSRRIPASRQHHDVGQRNYHWMAIISVRNTVYQFHGCFYHGHKCYLNYEDNPKIHKSMSELRQNSG